MKKRNCLKYNTYLSLSRRIFKEEKIEIEWLYKKDGKYYLSIDEISFALYKYRMNEEGKN